MRLINKDCFEAMDKLIDEGVVVDCILTDPPYGTTQCAWDSVLDFAEIWKRLNKLIKPNGAVVLFGSEPFSSALRMSNMENYKYDWIWHKNKPTGFVFVKTQPMRDYETISVFQKELRNLESQLLSRVYFSNLFKYINKPQKEINDILGHRAAENCFQTNKIYFNIPSKDVYKQLENVFNIKLYGEYKTYKYLVNDMYSKHIYNPQNLKNHTQIKSKNKTNKEWIYQKDSLTGKQYQTEHENYPRQTLEFKTASNTLHPTQKPVPLLEYLIRTYTNENETVLDFTMGSGSTGVACKQINREFIGIELDKSYFDIAVKRIETTEIKIL